VKVQRWRGAVWTGDDAIPRLVAAGQRPTAAAKLLDEDPGATQAGRDALN
jgi:hypothetical protein